MAQPLLNDNVVAMERMKRDTRNVGNDIVSYLNNHNRDNNSEKLKSTAGDYERDIKRFFHLMWGKSIHQLTIEHLDILPIHIENYQTNLKNLGYMGNTINRNIHSIRALYSFFEQNKYRYKDKENEWVYITASIFDKVDNVSTLDQKSYGVFTDSEIKQMIQLVKKQDNGMRKSLAIELASVTSFRLESIATIKKSDFTFENGAWVAKVIDKKKWNVKAIRTDLYERLIELAVGDKIFNLTSRTLQRAVDTVVEEMDLDTDRNLTFHSIKKYGIGEVYMLTNGDFKAVAEQGNHASYETTMKHYLMFNNDYSKMPCLQIGQPIDTSPLQELSKEELMNVILAASRSTQYELLKILENK